MPSEAKPPEICAAVENDLDILLSLMRQYYAFDGHAFELSRARPALLALLRDSSLGRVWLIRDRGTVAGYVVLAFGYSLEYVGRDAFIDELFLKEEFRGRGWGRFTLEFVENAARELGVRSIHLEVTRKNTHALNVYRKLGFLDHDHFLMSKWIEKDFPKPGEKGRRADGSR
jgi:diamine N-acetyltransferase